MRAVLDHIEDITEHVKTFWFKPEKDLRYEAGQFVELALPHSDPDDRGIRRWFTLSSSPTDDLIAISTKLAIKPSSFKKHLFGMSKGDVITVSDAMGDFVLPKDKSTPLLFVAGGIGITPAHSMTKWLLDTKEQRAIHLIYAAHSDDELAFRQLFDSYARTVQYIVQEPSFGWTDKVGNITSGDIYDAIISLNNPFVFLSGPEEMVEVFVAELKQKGVNPSRLITDYFPGYAGSI